MLKLNAGLSRKVGEANYGSRGASVNLELEVESNLVNDPDGLLDRIRRLFGLARQAVDHELNGQAAPGSSRSQPAGTGGNGQAPQERRATASQVRAIRAIADRLGADPEQITRDISGSALADLSLRQASGLIDELKRRAGEPVSPGGNGRGR